ncbi:MAG TPA: dephospho-CoA kinase [Gammaproteobacteria bacterium]|nr:dephospho-CoA kinase [Gammaproteobacteria bacterium]
MLTIGLTGGVGCGKSTIADLFQRQNVPVIDADIIARDLVAPDSRILRDIVAAFGEGILLPDGQLNRRKLRRIAFEQHENRRRLENILHPAMRSEILARKDMPSTPYCLVVIPLLVESGMIDLVDRVLVVDCDEAQQIARVTARDSCTADEVRAIIASQASRDARLAAADDVILNTGDIGHVTLEVTRLHQQYLVRALERNAR